MPIKIRPKKSETEKAWISRCMANPEVQAIGDNNSQKVAVCYDLWRRSKGLSASADSGFVALSSSSDPGISCGQNLQKKQIARKGIYKKGDLIFEISEDTLNHWVEVFLEMSNDGVDVFVPNEHENDRNKSHGTIKSLFVEGDGLFGIFELDEQGVELAKSKDVSLYSPPLYMSDSGKLYKRPITHVCFTSDPALTNLSGWELAASLKFVGENNMPIKKALDELKEGLKIEDDLTEENFSALVLSSFKTVTEERDSLKGSIDTLKQEVAALKEKKDDDKKDIDPQLVSLSLDNRKMKLNQLCEGSKPKLTPNARKKLEEVFCTKDAMTLALSNNSVDDFDKLIDILKANDPVELAEKSKHQDTLELSDPWKEGTDNPLLKDAEARAKAFN